MTTAATLLSELEAQLEAQRRAFARGAPDHRRRMQALAALRDGMHARQEELVRAVSDDFGGRPARSKTRRCAAFSETKSYTAAPHSALPRAQYRHARQHCHCLGDQHLSRPSSRQILRQLACPAGSRHATLPPASCRQWMIQLAGCPRCERSAPSMV